MHHQLARCAKKYRTLSENLSNGQTLTARVFAWRQPSSDFDRTWHKVWRTFDFTKVRQKSGWHHHHHHNIFRSHRAAKCHTPVPPCCTQTQPWPRRCPWTPWGWPGPGGCRSPRTPGRTASPGGPRPWPWRSAAPWGGRKVSKVSMLIGIYITRWYSPLRVDVIQL